ncbi:MAG: MFS transporter [Solirubrobacterales bacterium]|nr:MFS transporter [Solirubrobacterales bacterium]MCB8914615.1 MFS transporter [Thermoleophilales bacterium]
MPGSSRFQSPHFVLAGCCLALVLVMASVTSVNLALEGIAVDLGAAGSDLTWIADAYTVALAALVLPFGALGDDKGRKNTLVIGTVIFGIAAGVAATSDTVGFLIACRAVMGVGAALIMPSTLSTVTSVFPEESRPRAVAIWAGFASAGAVLGLLMSGLLLEYFEWKSTFLAVAILAAISLVATLVFIPHTSDEEESHPDPVGAGLTAIGIGALVYGVIEGAEAGWGATAPVVAFIVAAVAITSWAIHDSRVTWPMLDPRLFRLKGLSSGSLTLVLIFLGAFGFFYVGLQYVQLVLDFGPLLAAVSFLPIAVVVMPISALTPKLAERWGDKPLMAGGLILMGIAFWLITGLTADSEYPAFLLPMCVFAFGMALASTPSTNAVVASLPPEKQGVASALNDVTRELGAAIGIALLGSLFNSGYSDNIADKTGKLPAATAEMVKDSPAVGIQVAESPKLGKAGPALEQGVHHAFMQGMDQAFIVGAIVMLVGLLYVLLRAPGRRVEEEGPEATPAHMGSTPAAVMRRDGAVPAWGPAGSPFAALKAQVIRMAPPKPKKGELWPPPKPPWLQGRSRSKASS